MHRNQTDLFGHSFATAEPANPLRRAAGAATGGGRAPAALQEHAGGEPGLAAVAAGRARRKPLLCLVGYAWWAPRTSAPLKAGTGFGEAPEGAIFLRDIRHHDDHSQAAAHSFYDHNLPVAIPELRGEEYGPAPWTAPQARFAGSRQRVRIPELEAECLEEMGEYGRAAAMYREMGKLKEALACFRSVPDFDAAAALIRDIGEHPAAEAYRWLEKMRAAVAERPGNFNRVMQAPEKKLLEQMLSEALGVARKPAARKAAPKATTRGAAAATKKPGRPPKKRPLS